MGKIETYEELFFRDANHNKQNKLQTKKKWSVVRQ
jgi:hypothetical protein